MVTRLSGWGKSSDCSQIVEGELGLPHRPAGRFPLEHFSIGLAKHLDLAQRVFPIFGAKIEVVQRESLLEYRGIGILRNRHEGGAVVTHVVPADYIGAVGQPSGVLLVGRAQKQRRRIDRSASDHYDIGGVFFRRALARDDDFGHDASGWVCF
jgi:hypothetical protein